MEMVTRLAKEHPVVIFSKSSCCMSHTVRSLISSFGANPIVYELDEMPNGPEIERALIRLGCKPTVPTVFIGNKLIGGADEVMSLNVKNKLAKTLMDAKAIWVWKRT